MAGGQAVCAREWSRQWARRLWPHRLRPLVAMAGLGWAIFTAFRAVLMLARLGVVKGAPATLIARCFAVGLLYDSVPIGYAMLPMVLGLMLVGDAWLGRRWFRRAVTAYAAAAVVVVIVTESVGTGFFLHFGLRLNWMALGYVGEWVEVSTYLWNNYPAMLLLLGPVAGYWIIFHALHWLFWRGQPAAGPSRPRWLLAVPLTGLCLLACHGGLAPHPLQLRRAYFSDNETINQLSLNNFFTLARATESWLDEEARTPPHYDLPPVEGAARLAAAMLFQDRDAPLPRARNPLARRTLAPAQPGPLNVVLILMEGMSGRPVGALGNSPSHTPDFDALCREGVFFDRVYAVGARTSFGVVGVLCGHPDLGGPSLLKRPRAQRRFLTLPEILRRRGYRTLFIYGGDPRFDNMQGFFSGRGGIETFVGQHDLAGRRQIGNWGVPDEVILRGAHRRFEELGDQPFFAFILTVSNHEPYEVPAGRCDLLPPPLTPEDRFLNAYRYADWALADFFRLARSAPYFRRTVFVMIADHGRRLDRARILDVPGFRVPLLIYAPGIVAPRRVSTVGSQTDVPVTLLSLLGGSFDHCFLGRDLLSVDEGDGFALMDEGDRLAFLRGDRALVLSPRGQPLLFRIGRTSMEPLSTEQFGPEDVQRFQQEMLSYYGTAWEVYRKGEHDVPAPPAGPPDP